MYRYSNFPFFIQSSDIHYTDASKASSSVDLNQRFPFIGGEKAQEYRKVYDKNVGLDSQLSIQVVNGLFSYLSLTPRVFTHLWSLCDTNSRGSLSLPEFLLFIHFLDIYLYSGELPTTLPPIIYQELSRANRNLADFMRISDLNIDSSKDGTRISSSCKSSTINSLDKKKLTTLAIRDQEKVGAPFPTSKEPPDDIPNASDLSLSKITRQEEPLIHPELELVDLRETYCISPTKYDVGMESTCQFIHSQYPITQSSLEYSVAEHNGWEDIEQLKVKIEVIQNEIRSVEESQPDLNIDFDQVTVNMIDLSEQRYQLEIAFSDMTAEVSELVQKARHLNEELAIARRSLLCVNGSKESGIHGDEELVLSRFSETHPHLFTQKMQGSMVLFSSQGPLPTAAQTGLESEQTGIESERRKLEKEIERIERKMQRMNKRSERDEQYIHLYSDILMRKGCLEADGFLNTFMNELKNYRRQAIMTEKASVKPLSPIDEIISVDPQAVLQKSQNSPKEKQNKILEEAQKRLIEREKHLREDFSRLREEKKNMDVRIRRQEGEWKSIRLQALAQAQTTIANARAEMEAAREEAASRANRNNRARLAEETQVIEKLAKEKIEAADHERHAIERLAKQKIDAACQEKESLEKKFRERMCQVEIALKKTEHEKQEIKHICEGKQGICNSHMPPPNPPPSLPPLPVSIFPSLTGIKPLWLAHTAPSPTDFPRTSISSIQRSYMQPRQKCSSNPQSYLYITQPHALDIRCSSTSDWSVQNDFGHIDPSSLENWGMLHDLEELQADLTTQQLISRQIGSPCSSDSSDLKPPFSVKALYSYSALGEEYLDFEKDVYIIVDPTFESEEWWYGKLEYGLQEGWFPKNYVCIEQIPDQVPFLARVLYDYQERQSDELTIKADSVVDILEKTDVNWWKAQYEGNIGMIPARYVQQLVVGFSH